jgi:methionine-gamma-lyase
MKKYDSHAAIEGKDLHPESLMMSYGYRPDWSEGAIKCPIFQTSTFVFSTAEEGKAFFEIAYGLREKGPKEKLGLIYSRLNNPDLEILEDRLTLWDNAEEGAVFNSGMAAISTALLQYLKPGDMLFHSEPLYGGTDYFINHVLPKFNINPVGFRAGRTPEEIEEALATCGNPEKLAMIFIETPSNPTNALVDISACKELAQKHSGSDKRVLVVVDNTFLGPVWQQPIKHGADLVIYSATKFIGGHSDLIAGVCLGSKELMDPIRGMRTFLGNMADAWTGWLLMRSMETLKLRMTSQMKNARHLANFLADHPKVEKVYYLGHLTENDPQFKIYRKQCLAPGSMVSFDIVGEEAHAFKFLNSLKLIKLAVSLGGTESLAEHPATMTHSDIEPEAQQRMGITEKLIRISVGVENPEDLVLDIKQALRKV